MLYDFEGWTLQVAIVSAWLFFGILAFGVLNCHLRNLRLLCCEEAQALQVAMRDVLANSPVKVPANSIDYQIYEIRHLQMIPDTPPQHH